MEKETIMGKGMPYEKWLDDFLNDDEQIIPPHNCFPTDEYKERYISEIDKKSDLEVKNILRRFLPKNSTYVKDNFLRKTYISSLPSTTTRHCQYF